MKIKQSFLFALFIFSSTIGVKAQITQIPFEFNGSHLYIKVQTGKSDSLRFVFDTGCTGATIDSAAAEKAGIMKENRQNVSVAGSGGSQAYTMAVHQNLKLNHIEIKDVNLVVANMAPLSAGTDPRIDGIIGYEILNQYITQIDFDHKIITLYDQIKSADTAGYTGIPFEFNKNIMIPRFPVSVTLANGETFTGRAMFDTGNVFSLTVSTPFNKYHNFDSKLGETLSAESRGMNAFTQDQLANIKEMSFGGFNFGSMGIRLTVNNKAEPKDGYLGILGIEVIKHFNVILDYANKKIYLKPNQSYSAPFQQQPLEEKIASKAFLEQNKTKPGVKVTPSGLQYKIIRQGNGPKPAMQGRVSLHFTASLINGKKLWSTRDKNNPWVHRLDKMLDGVIEAALMMPAGSRWVLYIPAPLAFGDAGDGESVPPGAALIYDLELLKSEK